MATEEISHCAASSMSLPPLLVHGAPCDRAATSGREVLV